MRQRWVHACAVALATVLVVLGLVPSAFAETVTDVKVVSANPAGSVTVHVYDGTATAEHGDGSLIDTTVTNLGNPIPGVTMSAAKVGELVQVTETDADGSTTTSTMYAVSAAAAEAFEWSFTGNQVSVPNLGNSYLVDTTTINGLLGDKTSDGFADNDKLKSWFATAPTATDAEGKVTFTGHSGLYLFIASELPADVTVEVAPFFASVPMPAASDSDWNTAVHAYPKVSTASPITLSKEVAYAGDSPSYTTSMSVSSDKTLTYRITATIPANVKNLDEFTIGDAEAAGLDIDMNSITVGSDDFTLVKDTDYTVENNTGSFSVALTQDGCGKIAANATGDAARTIVITYDATVHESMKLGTNVDNVAMLTYSYTNNDAKTEVKATATVFTYGIDLTKTFQDPENNNYPGNATFELYKDSADGQALTAVKGTDGSYWLSPSTAKDATSDLVVTQVTGAANGTLVIKGLAAGTYYLKETAAPVGYSVLRDPIKIVVTAGTGDGGVQVVADTTATVNDTDATIDVTSEGTTTRGLVQLTVENVKDSNIFGFLPATGDAGTFLLVAVGVGLVCLAVVFMSKGRRDSRRA